MTVAHTKLMRLADLEVRRPWKLANVPILHADRHIMCFDKPPGLLSQRKKHMDDEIYLPLEEHARVLAFDEGGKIDTLHMYHRLDRLTSGLALFIRNKYVLSGILPISSI